MKIAFSYLRQMGVGSLGEDPLQAELREASDKGHPPVSWNPDAPAGRAVEKAASGATAALTVLEAF